MCVSNYLTLCYGSSCYFVGSAALKFYIFNSPTYSNENLCIYLNYRWATFSEQTNKQTKKHISFMALWTKSVMFSENVQICSCNLALVFE